MDPAHVPPCCVCVWWHPVTCVSAVSLGVKCCLGLFSLCVSCSQRHTACFGSSCSARNPRAACCCAGSPTFRKHPSRTRTRAWRVVTARVMRVAVALRTAAVAAAAPCPVSRPSTWGRAVSPATTSPTPRWAVLAVSCTAESCTAGVCTAASCAVPAACLFFLLHLWACCHVACTCCHLAQQSHFVLTTWCTCVGFLYRSGSRGGCGSTRVAGWRSCTCGRAVRVSPCSWSTSHACDMFPHGFRGTAVHAQSCKHVCVCCEYSAGGHGSLWLGSLWLMKDLLHRQRWNLYGLVTKSGRRRVQGLRRACQQLHPAVAHRLLYCESVRQGCDVVCCEVWGV